MDVFYVVYGLIPVSYFLQGKLSEVESVCASKDSELASVEQLLHSTRDQLESSEVTVYHLQRQVAIARQRVDVAHGEASQMEEVVGAEAELLREESRRCGHELTSLRAEAMEVRETSRITEAVNQTREGQIDEREARVSR